MAVIIYNPKTFNGNPSAPVAFLFDKKLWKVGVNEVIKFPKHIADEMLDRYGFLEKVAPEGLADLQKRMKDKEFKCDYCESEFDSEKALNLHKMRKHKLSEENEVALKSIPEAIAEETSFSKATPKLSPENQEGIPTGNKIDKDGVEWYGPGEESDTGFIKKAGGTF